MDIARQVVLAGLCTVVALPAAAQETIVDPKNPAASDDEADEQPDDEDDAEDEDDDGANARRPDLLNRYRTRLSVDTAWEGEDEDVVELSTQYRLGLDYEISDRLTANLEGEFWHWMAGKEREEGPNFLFNASDPRATYRPRLGETYLSYRTGDWAFRGGNLTTRWGSTDLVRPGDVIGPRDFVQFDGTAAGSDLLLPQLTAEAQWSSGGWSVSAIVVPFFVEDEVAFFGRDFSAAGPFAPLAAEEIATFETLEDLIPSSRYDDVQPLSVASSIPEETPGNASAGARATLTRWNTDFGLGYFFGWDRTPWLEVEEDFQELPFGEYRRQHNLVADFSRYVGPIGVRADAAFAAPRTFYTTDFEPVRRPSLTGALGLSWERLRDEDDMIAVTLEGFWTHPFSSTSGLTRALIPDEQRGPDDAELLLFGDDLYGLAAATRASLPWELELQLGAVATISNRDLIASASLSRRWKSWLRTGLGVSLFEGPEPDEGDLSLGGLYDHNDQVTLEVSGSF